jgi:hypothetical protein
VRGEGASAAVVSGSAGERRRRAGAGLSACRAGVVRGRGEAGGAWRRSRALEAAAQAGSRASYGRRRGVKGVRRRSGGFDLERTKGCVRLTCEARGL